MLNLTIKQSEALRDKSSAKRSLLYIITKSELGGAQSHVRELIEAFHKDYTIHLAVGQVGVLTESVAHLALIHVLPALTRNISLFNDSAALVQCVSLIQKIQPSLIHTHSSKAGLIGRLAGQICGVPTLFTAHGWGFTPNTPKVRRAIALIAEKALARMTTRVVCVSEDDRQLALRKGVATQQTLTTIRYGIPNQSVAIADPSLNPPRLIMVARFNEQKDQATLLKAIALLKDESFSVDFVGSGESMADCQSLADSLGLSNRVSFLGDRRDVSELLARSQVFVLSTHYEGLPISILEAMRSGLPVVATAVNGVPEEVVHGQTGLVIPHEDVSALAEALRSMIGDPQMRAAMGRAGREKFLREFTLETMTDQLKKIYDQVAKY